MHWYEAPEAVQEETDADEYIAQTEANLDNNIIPFVENHPETTFYIFYPPYSILYWNNVLTENHLEATMNQYLYTAERLLEYDNVKLYYFQNMEETVTDLNNYADYTHYKPEINSYMVDCFGNGEHQVESIEQMEKELLEMRRIIDDFDFEELFSINWT